MEYSIEKALDEYRTATRVLGQVFNTSGKWKYEVWLDYSRTETIVRRPSGYIDPNEAAELALKTATDRGTSGVTFSVVYEGWSLVVFDPPNGWPIMVRGGMVGLSDKLFGGRT